MAARSPVSTALPSARRREAPPPSGGITARTPAAIAAHLKEHHGGVDVMAARMADPRVLTGVRHLLVVGHGEGVEITSRTSVGNGRPTSE